MRRLLLILLLCIVWSVPAAAEEGSLYDTDALLDAVPEDVLAMLEGITPTETGSLVDGAKGILSSLSEQSGSALKAALRCAAVVMAIVLLCSVVGQFGFSVPANAVTIAGALAIMTACAGSIHSLILLGRDTLDQIQVFSNVLLPTMAAATVAVGATASSAAIYTATVLFSNLLINLITVVFLPMIYAYLALCTADAVLDNSTLQRVAKLIRWLITNGLKWLLLIFTGYVTVSGVISGSADSAQIRAAKLALSGAVPVVGSIIADASETVLVSAALLRSSVGVFGMLVIFGICAYPFLRIGVQYLIFQAAAALSAAFGEKRLIGVIDAVSAVMGFLLAMTGTDALLLLISCVCSMKAVGV